MKSNKQKLGRTFREFRGYMTNINCWHNVWSVEREEQIVN